MHRIAHAILFSTVGWQDERSAYLDVVENIWTASTRITKIIKMTYGGSWGEEYACFFFMPFHSKSLKRQRTFQLSFSAKRLDQPKWKTDQNPGVLWCILGPRFGTEHPSPPWKIPQFCDVFRWILATLTTRIIVISWNRWAFWRHGFCTGDVGSFCWIWPGGTWSESRIL